MEDKKRGAPAKWVDPQTRSITSESFVFEFFRINKQHNIGKALQEWVEAHKPRDMSAADYRLLEISNVVDRENDKTNHIIKTLRDDLGERLAALEAERKILLQQRANDISMLRKFWPEFRKAYPNCKFRPETWKGDMEPHPWWENKGIGITYGGLYDIFDEMEAHT